MLVVGYLALKQLGSMYSGPERESLITEADVIDCLRKEMDQPLARASKMGQGH